MADDFRNSFVGEKGYDALKKLMKNGNDFCTDVAKCLQERSDAEVAYVKALRKNADTLKKLSGRTKGTLALAFTTLSTQTDKEADAHSVIANTLLNEISIPMKNLAETQMKERRSIEDSLNTKFKEWNAQKDIDNKNRTRQFEKSQEIESLSIKISELSSGTKSSTKSKANSVSTPLVMSCILPASRYTNASEKLESSIKKAEEDLEKIERKYHNSTKDVELLRQACDIEMSRKCDELQKMELTRISEIANFIRTYANSFQILDETMHQIAQDLYSIQIIPSNDIIVQARSNAQSTEIEILLYDIYAENTNNLMNEQRRILSLMHWMEMLRRDFEIQQQTKNVSSFSLKSNEINESDDDDRGASSDGAMCSPSFHSQKDVVLNSVHHRDESSSSSNDDDGAMTHTKREKKKNEGFSSEIFVDRRGALLLGELYRGSLYKIESVYNRLKNLPSPKYEHAQQFTGLHNDKGYPTTILRLPSVLLTQTPPSAPSTIKWFAQAMPTFAEPPMQIQPVAYSLQRQAPPPIGWPSNEQRLERSAPGPPYPMHDRMIQQVAAYPVLMTQAAPPPPPPPPANKHVRALYSYDAEHKDELSLKPGDIIVLLERRKDKWCRGNLDGKIGLFPGNYVEEI